VIQHAENVKLVLLSATPMFNDATEIIWILNLLLANDKRPLLSHSKVFDKSGNVKESGKAILADACRGYISFMQGENPFSFPLRLYPSINADKNIQKIPPQLDIKGKPIPADKQLKHLELIQSTLSDLQKEVMDTINVDDEEDGVTNTQVIQISNIVFPNKMFGATGFKAAFNIAPKTHVLSYKPGVPQFLSPDLIQSYAPKIKKIVDYIKKSEGIIFVYSYYLDSGIIPLALALEHNGFTKYGGTSLLTDAKKARGQGTYCIMSAKKELTPDPEKEMEVLKSEANKSGDLIKVILGSSVSAEGLDFKCIREIHMLDPWYHLNKVEQIVGRAIRNCSHIALPPEQRNVTIYHHVCSLSKSGPRVETVDERAYRIAENKQSSMDIIENIMKSNAIDCQLNWNQLNIQTDIKIDIETSQGKKIKQFPIQPKLEAVKCAHIPEGSIDNSTFNKDFYKEEIEEMSKIVAGLFAEKHYYTYEDLKKAMGKVDEDILMYTLDHMLTNKVSVTHATVPGYLIYRSNIYMFQPSGTSDLYIPLRARERYKRKKENKIVIDVVAPAAKKKNTAPNQSIVTHMENQVSELETIIKSKMAKQVLYDYIIDRMDFSSILELVKELFIQDVSKSPILTSLTNANILVNKTWLRNIFAQPLEYVQWSPEGKKFTKVSLRELNSTKLPDVQVPNLSSLRGYVERKDKSVKFKIIDTEKTKSNGYVCTATSTLKIDVLRKMITDSKPDAFTDLKKPVLCDVFELVLRQDAKGFARPYEAALALRS